MPEIWLEKYRPVKFEDVVGNAGAVSILRSHAAAGTFPHLLLSGPPGCGKTTVVHCLAREHLGSFYEQGCIELNASDDRGIDVVREKIKGFAQQKVSLPEGKLKVIILDEADSMTQAAQQAMRRTMEIFSQTTRFALACNISSKIIEPIQSRCAILRFGRISDEDMIQRLKFVLEKEGAPYDQSGLEALVFSAEGDMRNALNGAQSTFNAFGEINRSTVFRMNDQPQPEKIRSCLDASLKKDMKGTFAPMHEIWQQGYSATDIISTFSRVAKQMDAPEHVKLEWLKEVETLQRRHHKLHVRDAEMQATSMLTVGRRPSARNSASAFCRDGAFDKAGTPTEWESESQVHGRSREVPGVTDRQVGGRYFGLQGASVNKAKIICQQCLAPGHWTYECKNGSTYQVRASASRQLKQKRFKQAFLEEEAPDVPFNAFLGDDRLRFGQRKEAAAQPEKKQKTEKDEKEKKEKKKKKESSSSSSDSSDSSSSS
ncbi:unnamed protein product [Effrenium voratum]|nr:unnamed protein product [Effrenium voratum]